MSRVLLVHWHVGEAEARAAQLERAGHEVRVHSDQSEAGARRLREVRGDPPQVFVIDLGRLPSHGRAVATVFRQRKTTRGVPLVFVDGDPEKVARVRELFPDAVYASWRGIAGAVRRALAHPPARPVVPDTMAGYSGTPLPKKLGIKPGARVVLVGAPAGFAAGLGPLPAGAHVGDRLSGRPGLILLFNVSQAQLARRFPTAARALADGGGLWILWPKKTSGVDSDLTPAHVRAFGLAAGFVDYKVCAVDATWSGLLFARRQGTTAGTRVR